MPTYGAHAVLSGKMFRAEVQFEKLDLTIDPADMITAGKLDGNGERFRLGLGMPIAFRSGVIEPFVRADRLRVDIDSANLTGNLGTLTFDTQKTERYRAGVQSRFVVDASAWSIIPSFNISMNREDGEAISRFIPLGAPAAVLLSTPRESTFWDADAGISFVHKSSGFELYAQGTGRKGSDVDGYGLAIGARVRF
jgi:hypothetical protein